MIYSFLERLIFFWLTLVDIYCLEFISHYMKEILYANHENITNHENINNHEIKTNHLFLILMLKNPVFFNVKLKFLMNNLSVL